MILPLWHRLTLFTGWCLSAAHASADLPSTSQPFKSGTGYSAYRIPAMAVSNRGTVIVATDGRANLGDILTAIDCVIPGSLSVSKSSLPDLQDSLRPRYPTLYRCLTIPLERSSSASPA